MLRGGTPTRPSGQGKGIVTSLVVSAVLVLAEYGNVALWAVAGHYPARFAQHSDRVVVEVGIGRPVVDGGGLAGEVRLTVTRNVRGAAGGDEVVAGFGELVEGHGGSFRCG
jgi:hypothetical protein